VERVYRAPTTGQTTPQDLPVSPAPSTPSTSPSKPPPTSTSPESQPGGGGGEEPARTEVRVIVTRDGSYTPHVAVAAYISVSLTFIAEDGSSHKLTIAGKTLSVGPGHHRAHVTLPGLRPGRSYRGLVDGVGTVRIRSTSEPGP
jgi:hypothetical protein